MTRQLVLVHGRSQQHKDPTALKAEWVDALSRGLAANGLALPIEDPAIRFPYYGDTLDQLAAGATGDIIDIVIKGTEDDAAERDFLIRVLQETVTAAGISDDQIARAATQNPEHPGQPGERGPAGDPTVITERGVKPSRWMHAILRALDAHAGFTAGAALALATHDVYQYLRNPGIRDTIDTGVLNAISPDVETVVVAHSLGSVVAYNIMRTHATRLGWKIPLLVTVGSPLGVGAITRMLTPMKRPPVTDWLNAADPIDIVALWPLAAPHVNFDPAVRNKMDVDNGTDNHHGISHYLDDPDVAKTIYDALTA